MTSTTLQIKIARACAGIAGGLAVFAGLMHHIFGVPILQTFLTAQHEATPALAQQIEASWTSATLSLILFGGALLFAAFKRPTLLPILGAVIGVWLAAYAGAEQLGAGRWGRAGLAPEALILCVIALLSYAAAFFSRPQQP